MNTAPTETTAAWGAHGRTATSSSAATMAAPRPGRLEYAATQ
ncbi:hypothetical protein ACFQY7_07330 [Actinomadura luteofluorescens]